MITTIFTSIGITTVLFIVICLLIDINDFINDFINKTQSSKCLIIENTNKVFIPHNKPITKEIKEELFEDFVNQVRNQLNINHEDVTFLQTRFDDEPECTINFKLNNKATPLKGLKELND